MIILNITLIMLAILLGFFVLIQSPKGRGVAHGFSGIQQFGGVRRTSSFIETGTWLLFGAISLLCLASAA